MQQYCVRKFLTNMKSLFPERSRNDSDTRPLDRRLWRRSSGRESRGESSAVCARVSGRQSRRWEGEILFSIHIPPETRTFHRLGKREKCWSRFSWKNADRSSGRWSILEMEVLRMKKSEKLSHFAMYLHKFEIYIQWLNSSQGTRDQIDDKFVSEMCNRTAFGNILLTWNHCFQNEAETARTRDRWIVACGGDRAEGYLEANPLPSAQERPDEKAEGEREKFWSGFTSLPKLPLFID